MHARQSVAHHIHCICKQLNKHMAADQLVFYDTHGAYIDELMYCEQFIDEFINNEV